MITYGSQSIDRSDIKGVIKVLKSKNLTQGPFIQKFESELKKYFNCNHAVAVSSGSAALHLLAKALDWSNKDIIATTPITFVATANCIEHVGAKLDLIDIEEETYNLDPNILEHKCKKLSKLGKKFKAVIAIDYAGHPCDWESLNYLSKKYSFQLINDNCHAIGARYNKSQHYAAKYALAATHSYHPVKNITTGEGGSVITNNKTISDKIKLFRTHGMIRDLSKEPWFYSINEIGFNYRLTDIQAALGISQLNKLEKFIIKRNKIAKFYNSYFKFNEKVKLPMVKKNVKHSYHLFPLLLDFKKIKKNKLQIFKELSNKKINLQVHYIPLHFHNYYKKKYNFSKGDFPVSEDFYKREISLPIYFDLKSKDQKYICDQLFKIL